MLPVVSSLELTMVHATLAYSDLRPNVNSSNYVVLVFANVGFRVADVKTNFGFIIWCYFPPTRFLWTKNLFFARAAATRVIPIAVKEAVGSRSHQNI